MLLLLFGRSARTCPISAERAGGSRALSAGELGGVPVRGIWSARECYCAVRVTVRRRWYDIVMLSSCALSEGVPGVRSFTLLKPASSDGRQRLSPL